MAAVAYILNQKVRRKKVCTQRLVSDCAGPCTVVRTLRIRPAEDEFIVFHLRHL